MFRQRRLVMFRQRRLVMFSQRRPVMFRQKRPVMYRWTIAALAAVGLIASCAIRPNGDLADRATRARTPGDHAAVATLYRQRAQQLRADADQHATLAARWAEEAKNASSGGH